MLFDKNNDARLCDFSYGCLFVKFPEALTYLQASSPLRRAAPESSFESGNTTPKDMSHRAPVLLITISRWASDFIRAFNNYGILSWVP